MLTFVVHTKLHQKEYYNQGAILFEGLFFPASEGGLEHKATITSPYDDAGKYTTVASVKSGDFNNITVLRRIYLALDTGYIKQHQIVQS